MEQNPDTEQSGGMGQNYHLSKYMVHMVSEASTIQCHGGKEEMIIASICCRSTVLHTARLLLRRRELLLPTERKEEVSLLCAACSPESREVALGSLLWKNIGALA